MATKRKPIKVDIKHQVLHESGYKCSNPVCRTILTLDIHHLEYVSKNGDNTPDNLLALCPNCHALHHKGIIPDNSLRAWKLIILSLNEACDRSSIDILLALDKLKILRLSGSGVLMSASLIASNLIKHDYQTRSGLFAGGAQEDHILELTEKGKLFVQAWKNGNQQEAVNTINRVDSLLTVDDEEP